MFWKIKPEMPLVLVLRNLTVSILCNPNTPTKFFYDELAYKQAPVRAQVRVKSSGEATRRKSEPALNPTNLLFPPPKTTGK